MAGAENRVQQGSMFATATLMLPHSRGRFSQFRMTLMGMLALAAFLAASQPASAKDRHHRHHGGARLHLGVVIGAPLYPYWHAPPRYYYPAPVYYYPAPVVAVPAAPPVYIEQTQTPSASASAPAAESDAASWWYFCRESNTYYPYVKSCPGGWQRVTPQVPPG